MIVVGSAGYLTVIDPEPPRSHGGVTTGALPAASPPVPAYSREVIDLATYAHATREAALAWLAVMREGDEQVRAVLYRAHFALRLELNDGGAALLHLFKAAVKRGALVSIPPPRCERCGERHGKATLYDPLQFKR